MVRIGMCVACQYGRHEEHRRVIQSVPEGMLGGAVCGCQGECQGRPTKAVQRQIDQGAAAMRRAAPSDKEAR